VTSGHRAGPVTALAFPAMARRLIADTGTAKSGPTSPGNRAGDTWPFLALWPLVVAPGMPVSASQWPIQVNLRETGHRRSKFLHSQAPLTALAALSTSHQPLGT
jgi:hypothetical protein